MSNSPSTDRVDPNAEFQQYVTGQAFVLVLSRPMIEALHWFAMNTKARDDYPTVPYYTSYHALKRRGLVTSGTGKDGRKPHITEEGLMVYELVKRAGLVAEQQPQARAA